MEDESVMDYSDAEWAAQAVEAMLARVRKLIATQYVAWIADLQRD